MADFPQGAKRKPDFSGKWESSRVEVSLRRCLDATMSLVRDSEHVPSPPFGRSQNMDKYLEARGVPYLKRLVICAHAQRPWTTR